MAENQKIKKFEEKLLVFFEEFKRSKRWLVPKIVTKFSNEQEIIFRHLHKKYKTPIGLKYILEDDAEEQRQIAAEIDSEEKKPESENL